MTSKLQKKITTTIPYVLISLFATNLGEAIWSMKRDENKYLPASRVFVYLNESVSSLISICGLMRPVDQLVE